MLDQILVFISDYPLVLALLPILAIVLLVRVFRRTVRRVGHIQDAKSWSMIAIGLVVTTVVIAIWLVNT